MIKNAGIRFNKETYIEIGADLEDMSKSTIKTVVDGTETNYNLEGGGGRIEKKSLYVNPHPSVEMSTDTMFDESEIEGYQYLLFVVTDTSGSFEVEEWCEIAPLKTHGGQFIVSMPISGTLYGRKVYRSSGAVKPSAGVYEIGKTTENRNACIIKSVDAVKGVE